MLNIKNAFYMLSGMVLISALYVGYLINGMYHFLIG